MRIRSLEDRSQAMPLPQFLATSGLPTIRDLIGSETKIHRICPR